MKLDKVLTIEVYDSEAGPENLPVWKLVAQHGTLQVAEMYDKERYPLASAMHHFTEYQISTLIRKAASPKADTEPSPSSEL